VDVRVMKKKEFGSALLYFTGSKSHSIALRRHAREMGLKVSEYGVFRGEKAIAGKTEEDCYRALDLPWIPPELRENRGEIEAAARGELPSLIELKDIRGDLHAHTTASDGRNSIEEMARAAREAGYEYIAITDHSKAVKIAGGLNEEELAKNLRGIERINAKLSGIRVLKGVEVDILGDGTMDLKDDILKECEVVIAAVHFRFQLPEKEMTRRIIKGIRNKYVNILAHPTGRLLLEREPYRVDLEEVIRAAAGEGVTLEINAHPKRLDLNDIHARMAKELGAGISIDTDSHSVSQLQLMKYGVFTARRGWLEKKDVINTLPLKKLLSILKR
jgi:DNA polymerase (family 10)